MSINEILDEYEKTCKKATPGPWAYGYDLEDYESGASVIAFNQGWICEIPTHNFEALRHDRRQRTKDDNENNGKFIAASRTAMPKLIKALRVATEQIATIAESTSRHRVYCQLKVGEILKILEVRND